MSERQALKARVLAARAANDVPAEAALLGDLSAVEVAWGDLDSALAALDRATQLYASLGKDSETALALYGASIVLWKQRPGVPAALKRLEQAEAVARRGGDLALLARILDHKAGMAVAAKAYVEAAALLNDVAALRESIGDNDGRLDAIRRMAAVVSLLGDAKRAFELLSEGLVGAEASLPNVLRARLDLNLFARSARTPDGRFPVAPGERLEPLGVLLTDAVHSGDHGLAGYIRLQLAADANQNRRPQEAATFAESARQDALNATDPMLYLMACLSIAEAREVLGDRVGVLTILFTCRATLVDLLGEQAGRPVLGVVDSLETRWGAAFAPALAAYRAQFA